jgi:hypothetical protein
MSTGSVQSPPAKQPCAICGKETAIGSPLHPARRSISELDGRNWFVCADCDEAARATRGGERLSDDELRNFVRSASLAGIAWSSG